MINCTDLAARKHREGAAYMAGWELTVTDFTECMSVAILLAMLTDSMECVSAIPPSSVAKVYVRGNGIIDTKVDGCPNYIENRSPRSKSSYFLCPDVVD